MPFKSKAQQKYMFAAAERGEIPKKTAEEFAHKTKDFKHLPEKVAKDMEEDKGCKHNPDKMCKACCKSVAEKGLDASSPRRMNQPAPNLGGATAQQPNSRARGGGISVPVTPKPMSAGSGSGGGQYNVRKSQEATELMKALTARMLSQVVRYQDHREKLEAARAAETPVVEEVKQPQRAFDASVPVERVVAPSPELKGFDALSDCGTCGYIHKSIVECPRCTQISATNTQTREIWRR